MMKILLAAMASLCLMQATAQSSLSCAASLDTLYDLLKKLPSFRQQMKGDNGKEYAKMYTAVRQEAAGISDPLQCFLLQSRLVLALNDNHLFFYQQPELDYKYAQLNDPAFLEQWRKVPWYRDFPRVHLSLDSLKTALAARPADSLEGIYWYGEQLQAGLFRTEKKDSLVGVILHSGLINWEPGQIAFILSEVGPERLRAWHAQALTKNFMLYRNERFVNGGLSKGGWKKDLRRKNYEEIPYTEPAFSLRWLTNDIQYLRLGSFSTFPERLKESERFYESIRDSLSAGTLVLDLRNNGGGGFKASMKYLKLLRGYLKKGRVYALINQATYSNAEQFAILLRREQQVLMLGQTTNGTMAYGNNYGNTHYFGGGKLALYPTDMKDDGNFLPYEDTGLRPDIILKAGSSWIDQVLAVIRGQ
ncbi:MAG: S41 family peptidase [Pseudobacter sp.]|uniref:S41 family peptidase n=1 Tax=Pseudobacter sp. TaxID=2045420 RepID=UPI003F7DDE0F